MEFRLPEPVQDALRRLYPHLHDVAAGATLLANALQSLDTLPASAVVRADHEVATMLGLHRYHANPAWWIPGSRPIEPYLELMRRVPGIDLLFLFHRDGRAREAALRQIDRAPPSAFFFAAITMRLNDWAGPVRAAAVACANRVFPLAQPQVVADAAVFLLRQRHEWLRWSPLETGPLDRALHRPEVAAGIAQILQRATQGPMGGLLRSALRGPGFDHLLIKLAQRATLPDVRRIAFEALITRKVRWPSHRERQWIDKSMGRYREGWAYASRDVESDATAEFALTLASVDRSAAVRRVAVVALLTQGRALTNFERIATGFADDPNVALRERAAFALSMKD